MDDLTHCLPRRIDALTRDKLRTISTATVATILFKRGLRNQFVQGVSRLTKHATPMVGQAYTLRHTAAREDIDMAPIFREPTHPQRVAVDNVPEGDVIVMDCRGDASAASLGGILATRLEVRGCAGVVTDAGVRDSDYIAGLAMPAYSAGRSAPTNLTRHHAIDINVPITCGQVPVYPGDVMLGDGDGVMVIPLAILDEVIAEGLAMEHFELFVTGLIRAGRPVIGTYPANDQTLALYAAFKQDNPVPFSQG